MLKRGSISWLIWNLVESVILIAGGVMCVVFCNNTDFQKTALLIVGILVSLDAVLRLSLGVIDVLRIGDKAIMRTDYVEAAAGSLELALGIVLILSYTESSSLEVVFKFIGLFIGIFLITIGAVAIVYAIVYIVKKMNLLIANIFSIIGAGIIVALGVMAIIYLTKQDTIMLIFLIILGLVLIASGVILGILTISIASKVKKAKAVIEDIKETVAESKEAVDVVDAEEVAPTRND